MLYLLIPFGISATASFLVGRKMAANRVDVQESPKKPLSAKFRSPITVEILREHVVNDESLVLATEEVPLDNRCGNQTLISEHEFIRTASVSMEIDRNRELGSSVRAGLWKAIETRATGEFSRSLGVRIGSQLTRRVRLRFGVKPGRSVRYIVVWSQESRRGEFEILVDQKKVYKVPYLVTYGLSHSVTSFSDHPIPEKADRESSPEEDAVDEDDEDVS